MQYADRYWPSPRRDEPAPRRRAVWQPRHLVRHTWAAELRWRGQDQRIVRSTWPTLSRPCLRRASPSGWGSGGSAGPQEGADRLVVAGRIDEREEMSAVM